MRPPGSHTVITDAELVSGIRRGDAVALTAMYRAHGARLLALATRFLGSSADAEDVLHDLVVGLPEAMRSYDERGHLGAWLKQVVIRMCLMRLRAASRRRETDLEAAGGVAARAGSPRDVNDAIETAIGELTPSIRAVVVLRLIEGLSHREIGETLGISANASEARLSRGLVALRSRLEKLI